MSVSLILSETPLGRIGLGGRARPGVAVTYATTRGDILRSDAVTVGLSCRVRYEIDISDHRDEIQWRLPSRDERLFDARIGVGWRVFDPTVITARRVLDGFAVILGYLHPLVRRYSRVLAIEQVHNLEDQINQLLAAGPARFSEGIEVYHVDAQLSFDERTVHHAETIRDLERDHTVVGKRHVVDLSTAVSQIDLDSLRRRAIEEMVSGENGLLLHHLTVHREDTMGVLKVLQEQDQTSSQARSRLLEQFKDRLLPEELDGLAELLIRHTKDSIERPGSPQLIQPDVRPSIVAGTTVPPNGASLPSNHVPAPLRTMPGQPANNGHPAHSTPSNGGDNVAEWRPVRNDHGGNS